MSMAFGKWDTSEVVVSDAGLAKYMNLDIKIVPHTFGKKAKKRFEKGQIDIVERLINKTMRSGQGKRKLSGKYIRGRDSCGKKLQAMEIIENAFEIIEKRTQQNPVQVLVKAIENSAPREDVTRVKKGGIVYSQAVDVAPLTRVDESLKNIAISAFAASFNNKKSASTALAEELIIASTEDSKSFSVKRRDEVERIAKASR
ncbi:MAG: 30S ribosomal protein S7 [Candidatus Diapherotrites archaeon]|uniref:Small ribosomal subunit protein uS7 n=1 Tax=Candidatus Iainarchaeum sp. TaxID=3101447 RepID=A0A2D6M0S3_9ARCH|nr:30S ribosomal protein S7 [Candidatus Diapherotrites archaeon]|tara:strand:- start:4348 stop:4950 length:603 start_codon:yes stop_codon:yes gene_type:complete